MRLRRKRRLPRSPLFRKRRTAQCRSPTRSRTNRPPFVKSLETPDGGAVVSRLVNSGKEYLMVVNRSPDKELTLKIAFAPGVKRIRSDGSIVDAVLYGDEYWLDPGAAEIFSAR